MRLAAPIAGLFSMTKRTVVSDLLVARLQRGEAAALAEAYDAHHEVVRAFARRLLGDHAAAEDLVHDVFVALPDLIGRFEGRSSLRTYLLSIAANHARHARRSRARRLGAYERLHDEPRSGSETPEEEAERRALAATLQRMLEELPMDQRIVVVLCLVEERTSVEAAEIVGVPEATVRTRLFYARKKLREMMDAEVSR
jgi:RNA polymerase sigma-70 factor (ECF subfamily)